MSPKIFLTGVTGYIGGTVFNSLAEKHPEFEYAVMVRSQEAAKRVMEKYPKVRVEIGDLGSEELLSRETANADIIINAANNDHVPSAQVITSSLSPSSYLIHTSGTSIILDWRSNGFGTQLGTKVYNDVDGVSEITSLPDEAWHRDVDRVVLESGKNTAIVCPCCIYGLGTGPGKKVSWQIPQLAKWTIVHGKGFVVNEGRTYWNHVHVLDLANLYVKLVEEALKPNGGKATWGPEGYYFAESGEHIWSDVSQKIAEIAHRKGLIKDDSIEKLTPEEIRTFAPTGHLEWGSNSRGIGMRARTLLGWEPKQKNLWDSLEEEVDMAAEALKKH
ncbi:NAD(P)-binding protein [Choiromyces venosus 120613-1]|uniref:NAD(P)-binding protein n=1 Tax=Choiromyces venosus 120613-1 TaxID=1336337 RepID=A0A3N4J5F0_9PEZI|nr:NAD(P)-binding protein [Choiromyces venosus 120613-1]RPA96222.1 NAD(P)-binding protein [Choiromyces venosus 120613-1]